MMPKQSCIAMKNLKHYKTNNSMKQISIVLGLVLAMSCTNKVKSVILKSPKTDSATTCIKIALNISMNDYKDVTAKRIVRDSVREQTVDTTSRGQIIREIRAYKDTSYFAWWPLPVPDSTGKTALKSRLGGDSVIYRFVPVQKEMVIYDYNCHFK